MSTTATPAASVAGTGATGGAAPSPSADLDQPLGTSPSGEGGGVATAEPEAGAPPEGGQSEAGADADAGKSSEEGLDADGRAVPAKWRELFKTDQELKALFFERRAFQKEFPGGIQEIRGLKQTLDLAGGEAGLQQMQTDISEFRTVATQFLDGDPGFVTDLFDNDPVAAATHIPTMLDTYQKTDEPGYNRMIAQRIHGEHAAFGLRPALKSAYDAIPKGPEGDEARKALNRIAGWHDKVQQIAEQEEDPRVKKLQDQIRDGRKTADAESLKQMNESYRQEAKQAIDKSVTRILDSYLKGKKLSDEDRSTAIEQILMRANKAINDDKDFIKQRDFIGGRRDKAALLKLSSARWDRELAVVIPKVVRLFGLVVPSKPATAVPANGAATQPGKVGTWTMVTAMPDPSKMDTYRTSRDMITKQHRAYLKDGTQVDWSRALAG